MATFLLLYSWILVTLRINNKDGDAEKNTKRSMDLMGSSRGQLGCAPSGSNFFHFNAVFGEKIV